jgi:hypothetical protein
MMLSRRALLLSVSAIAIGPLVAACTDAPSPNAIHMILTKHFGAAIAKSEPAQRFEKDLSAYLAAGRACVSPWGVCADQETRIVQAFLESTTFLASQTQAAEFDYIAIFDAYASPCSNQLANQLA